MSHMLKKFVIHRHPNRALASVMCPFFQKSVVQRENTISCWYVCKSREGAIEIFYAINFCSGQIVCYSDTCNKILQIASSLLKNNFVESRVWVFQLLAKRD